MQDLYKINTKMDWKRPEESSTEDIMNTKHALNALGHYKTQSRNYDNKGDLDFFDSVKSYQNKKNLKIDGLIKPGGATEKTLNEDLKQNEYYNGLNGIKPISPFVPSGWRNPLYRTSDSDEESDPSENPDEESDPNPPKNPDENPEEEPIPDTPRNPDRRPPKPKPRPPYSYGDKDPAFDFGQFVEKSLEEMRYKERRNPKRMGGVLGLINEILSAYEEPLDNEVPEQTLSSERQEDTTPWYQKASNLPDIPDKIFQENRRTVAAVLEEGRHGRLADLFSRGLERDEEIVVGEYGNFLNQLHEKSPEKAAELEKDVNGKLSPRGIQNLNFHGRKSAPGTNAFSLSAVAKEDVVLAQNTSTPALPEEPVLAPKKEKPPVLSAEDTKTDDRPWVSGEMDRRASLQNNTPGRFKIERNPDEDGGWKPHEIAYFGNRSVKKHDPVINEMAEKHDVDPDMIRAIMWAENARGHKIIVGNKIADLLRRSKTPLPMNVNKKLWSGMIGAKPQDLLHDQKANIEAATVLIKRISERIDGPKHPAKIGSIWNGSSLEETNDFGEAIGRIYYEKPWAKNDSSSKKR